MTASDSPFLDAVTSRVIGARALLERVMPDSELARHRWHHPALLNDYAALELLQSSTIQVAQWWLGLEDAQRERVRHHLSQVPLDIARVLSKLTLRELLAETELFALKRLLYHALELCGIAAQALQMNRDVPGTHALLSDLLDTLHPEPEPSPRFHLSESLSAELSEARQALTRSRRAFMAHRKALVALHQPHYPGARFDLEGEVSLSGELATRAALDEALVAHGAVWRIRDAELDAFRTRVMHEQELVTQLETSLRRRLTLAFSHHAEWFGTLCEDLTQLDVRLTRTRLRESIGGCWPRAVETEHVTIEGGRDPGLMHPQPIDFDMDHRPALITGPNMGGKSSLLRLVGLCQWCLQHGLPAPATSYVAPLIAHMVYVGSEEVHQDIPAGEGLSSFGREIRRLVMARASMAPVTLWLLDEVGRGTHPEDGAALAAELIEALTSRGDRIFFATHFPSLARVEGIQRWRIAGLTDRAHLEMLAAAEDFTELGALERALREAMDYRPVRWHHSEDAVPRDARLIARLLGW